MSARDDLREMFGLSRTVAPGKLAKSKFRAKPGREFLLAWVEALESGDFKKGKYSLCSTKGNGKVRRYCCLGVAAELNGDMTDVPKDPEDRLGKAFMLKDGDEVGLPDRLYGLRDDFMAELMTLNDENYGYAKVIERIKAEFPDVFPPAAP